LILHVITGLGDGGAEGVLYRLCKHDRNSKHVVVSLMEGGRYAGPLRELGVPVHSLGLARGQANVRAVLRLASLVRTYKPTVVQTWLYHADLLGGIVARGLRVPTVAWGIRHGELPTDKTKPKTVAIARLCARLSGFVPHRIVCCSVSARDIHAELGYDRSKLCIIPNGYETDHLSPSPDQRAAFRNELGVADGIPLLGMVARYSPQKDHFNLLSALGQLAAEGERFELALVGSGLADDNFDLLELSRRLGLSDRIHWLGRRSDISTVMNGLDLHVLSSASEGFPNVVAEAMLCGTPCVVTDVGDSARIVGNIGWVARPEDATSLAAAARSGLAALRDAEGWQRRMAAARERIVTRFGIEAMVAAYHKAWAGDADPAGAGYS
jgi:glycosyltransferase involved in cell wall biosynthesis